MPFKNMLQKTHFPRFPQKTLLQFVNSCIPGDNTLGTSSFNDSVTKLS